MTQLLRNRRRAFTLTEILVVIAIIGILASLAAWGVVAVIGNQRANNTTYTIKVVNKVLQSHWQYVIEEAKKDANAGLISQAVINMAQPDPTGERAQVLWIKFRLMEAFPQKYDDITNPFVYTADASGNQYIPTAQRRYVAAYQKFFAAPPFVVANNNAATQSAACLLTALSVNRGSNLALAQDQIGYAVADTDNDGIKELVDGWSPRNPLVPIKFTRFDTTQSFTTGQGVVQVNPAAAGSKSAKFADPTDPNGLLMSAQWYGTAAHRGAASLLFEQHFHAIETSAGSGVANYVIPSIISAGKDGAFGTPDDIISSVLR